MARRSSTGSISTARPSQPSTTRTFQRMNLIWATSVSAGALHAARALLTGRPLVDRPLAAALQAPAEALAAAVAASGCPAEAVWQHLLPLAATAARCWPPRIVGRRAIGHELAARVLGQIEPQSSPPAIDRLGVALARLEAAFVAAQPRVADELPLRREPLRGQWEARGPGLLFGVRRLTSVDWLVPSATIILLPPVLGGAGQAHPPYNVVTFEAVLANPIAQLPEVLRLGWLLAQLNPALAAQRRAGRGTVGGVPRPRRCWPWCWPRRKMSSWPGRSSPFRSGGGRVVERPRAADPSGAGGKPPPCGPIGRPD